MFNFWWLARLVNGLKPPLPPLSSQKHEMPLFGLGSTSDDQLGWSMDSNPILHLSPAKEMKCSFLYYVQLLMIGWAGQWTQTPSTTALQPKQWNAHFCITFNIWCWPDWSMDLNLIHHPFPGKKVKCSFLGYVQLLMISQAVRWTQTPSATPLQAIKWNAHILIMFNFWWLAGLVNGLEPIHQCSPAKKNEMLIFGLCSLLKICLADWWSWTPSATPLQPIKWNAHFWIMFTSEDLPGWLMNLNPIHHSSPANKMKCLFLYYAQLLMISRAGWWTQTPSANPLQPIKWIAHFCMTFNIWCWPDWSMDLNLIHYSSAAKNMKCSFLGYIQLLTISRAVRWTQTPSATPLQPIKWNAHFWITFNFW